VTTRRIALGLLFPLLFLLSWEVLARAGVLSPDGFSRISQIVPAGLAALLDGSLWQRTGETLSAAALGWLIAAALGIPGGLLLGLFRPLERIMSLTIEALRPIPSAALIPISLLIFGFSAEMGAAVAAFACLWPILIVTTGAVRGPNRGCWSSARRSASGSPSGYGDLHSRRPFPASRWDCASHSELRSSSP
jgi:NitT/TauT family transport system permease protein